jgi:hypothetical protein
MSDRKLLYSERLRLAETGSLGDLVHKDLPYELRRALRFLITGGNTSAAKNHRQELMYQATLYQTWTETYDLGPFIMEGYVEDVLDMLQLAVEAAQWVGFEPAVNSLFDRWRCGYVIENGDVRRIDSPILADEVTQPALLAVQRAGWEQVESSFREAVAHRRAGEHPDALRPPTLPSRRR